MPRVYQVDTILIQSCKVSTIRDITHCPSAWGSDIIMPRDDVTSLPVLRRRGSDYCGGVVHLIPSSVEASLEEKGMGGATSTSSVTRAEAEVQSCTPLGAQGRQVPLSLCPHYTFDMILPMLWLGR